MPLQRAPQLGKFKARTSLLTGAVLVRVSPGTNPIYYDALWVHETVHSCQWSRYIKKYGKAKGIAKFVLARKDVPKGALWRLESEAYRAQLAYLLCRVGKSKVSRIGWRSLLIGAGYNPEDVKELLSHVYTTIADNQHYCLGLLLGSGWLLPCREDGI